PIWPCTGWGFPCLRAYAWSGGLLPHLFTLTPPSFPRPRRSEFLWHFPSGCLAASPPACISPPAFLRRPGQLRGIAPYGVRTFLLPRITPGKAILCPSKIKVNIPRINSLRYSQIHVARVVQNAAAVAAADQFLLALAAHEQLGRQFHVASAANAVFHTNDHVFPFAAEQALIAVAGALVNCGG